MTQATYHIPALLAETLEALDIRPDGTYVDATYGGGGHSRAILDRLAGEGRLLGFDQDEEAVERAVVDPRFTIVHGNFRFLSNFLRYYRVDGVDGILADLGVSFHHFDDPERGFSFRWEGALDMRMNRRAPRSAAWLLANSDAARLASIFKTYGELPQARRLADAIVRARATAPVETVERLLEIARPLINPRQEKKELAQLFQALRIEVNDETGALRQLLEQALKTLKPGGRLAIITYHSIEDRMVKNFMKTGNLEGTVDKDFFGRSLAPMKLLTSRPVVASEAEVAANPRSRSAKLRVAVKL
ncbi:MAG: 16S rRNA (cytosine(1402)-N(4))-methyltransferase RsmH [Muribaculaceae bacterium]|nr:16S rRNA (cytosine(1402)-N(4))-methyltransferase RsmH [Muribaculaceae bacterium]